MFSLLDGFSYYNKIMVWGQYQHKTTFTAKWGIFTYSKIPFGISSFGVTIQQAMDIAFKEFMNKIILICLDNLTIFSK